MAKKDLGYWIDFISYILMIIVIVYVIAVLNGCAFYKTPNFTAVTCFKDIEIKDVVVVSDPNGPTILILSDYEGDSDGEEAGKFTGSVLKTLMGI